MLYQKAHLQKVAGFSGIQQPDLSLESRALHCRPVSSPSCSSVALIDQRSRDRRRIPGCRLLEIFYYIACYLLRGGGVCEVASQQDAVSLGSIIHMKVELNICRVVSRLLIRCRNFMTNL